MEKTLQINKRCRVFAFDLHFFPLYVNTFIPILSEWQHPSFRRILQPLPVPNGEYTGAFTPPNLFAYSCSRQNNSDSECRPSVFCVLEKMRLKERRKRGHFFQMPVVTLHRVFTSQVKGTPSQMTKLSYDP